MNDLYFKKKKRKKEEGRLEPCLYQRDEDPREFSVTQAQVPMSPRENSLSRGVEDQKAFGAQLRRRARLVVRRRLAAWRRNKPTAAPTGGGAPAASALLRPRGSLARRWHTRRRLRNGGRLDRRLVALRGPSCRGRCLLLGLGGELELARVGGDVQRLRDGGYATAVSTPRPRG